MATFKNIAKEMARSFILSSNKKYALNKIIHELNYLVYSDTKEPLNYKDKSAIIKHIYEVLAGREKFLVEENENISQCMTGIIIFFERRNFIITQLKTCAKERAKLN